MAYATKLTLIHHIAIYVLFYSICASGDDCGVRDNPDVNYFDVQLPEINVPNHLTSYVCQQFKIPTDQAYHAIAFEPIISNHHVMHHMLLFGCESDTGNMDPHLCGSQDQSCGSWLAQWTIGVEGQVCTPPQAGIRFGKNSFQYMSLQIHWNNDGTIQNQTDNSGMRIYYTTKLRQHDLGNVQIGQNDIEIPPLTPSHNTVGSCSGSCTRQMLFQPIYITRSYIHMHYLGENGTFDLYRNGQFVQRISEDLAYLYHKSPIHNHKPPVEVLPGDELRLTCGFDSYSGEKKRNTTLFFGEGSNAEMCYAFVTYYPHAIGFDQCIQFADYDVNCPSSDGRMFGGCNFYDLESSVKGHLLDDIIRACSLGVLCDKNCSQTLRELTTHPCMQGRLGVHSRRTILSNIPSWKKVIIIMDDYRDKCVV
ncbi:hypothetical protein ScPMuIL_009179 [Solemya velum]